jgi:hypothetical protein
VSVAIWIASLPFTKRKFIDYISSGLPLFDCMWIGEHGPPPSSSVSLTASRGLHRWLELRGLSHGSDRMDRQRLAEIYGVKSAINQLL